MAPLLWLVLPASSLRSRHPVRRTQVNLTCWSPTKRLAPDVVTTASEPSRLATRPHILLPPLLLLSCRVPTAWQLLQLAPQLDSSTAVDQRWQLDQVCLGCVWRESPLE